MHLLWTMLIGFLAGLLARTFYPGSGPQGFITTALLGVAGSLAATYAGAALGFYPPDHVAGFLASVIGAFALLAAYHLIRKQ